MAIAAANTSISSVFTISCDIPTEAQGTVTITNPGRAFRILGATAEGVAASVVTIKKNTSGGNIAAVITTDVSGETMWGALTKANLEFAATDNIFIDVATQNAGQVDILCVATGGGQTLTNAVT